MYSSHIHTSKPELGLQPAVVVLVVVVMVGGEGESMCDYTFRAPSDSEKKV